MIFAMQHRHDAANSRRLAMKESSTSQQVRPLLNVSLSNSPFRVNTLHATPPGTITVRSKEKKRGNKVLEPYLRNANGSRNPSNAQQMISASTLQLVLLPRGFLGEGRHRQAAYRMW